MNIRGIIKLSERFIVDNSPTILTAVGSVGVLTTAYLTGKATLKAVDVIREEEAKRAVLEPALAQALPVLDNKQKAKMVWKCYIPPAVAVASTIGCVVGANKINTNRLAAIAAAYAVSDRNFSEYKEKVKDMFGEGKEGKVRSALAEDAANAPVDINVERGHGGDTLCLDKWTGRFFTSDMQSIRAAENDLNKGLYRGNDRVATLGDFYNCLGLSEPKCAESVGWNADSPLDLHFDTVIREGKPVLVMDFANTPFPIHGVFGTA